MHLCPHFETERYVSEEILSDNCLLQEAFFLSYYETKNCSVLSSRWFQKSQNDALNHFITTHFQNCVYLVSLPQWMICLYKTKSLLVAGYLLFHMYVAASF